MAYAIEEGPIGERTKEEVLIQHSLLGKLDCEETSSFPTR
jgi:hypothetical protein